MTKICPSCGNQVPKREEPPYPDHKEDCEHYKAFIKSDFLITHVKKFPPKDKPFSICPSCGKDYGYAKAFCMECGYGII